MTADPNELLTMQLQRVSNTHHELSLIRPDGRRVQRRLESKSTLLHDLVHYAVESEAGLTDSFFGRIARGQDYDDLAAAAHDLRHGLDDEVGELGSTEKIVGALQTAWQRRLGPAQVVEAIDSTWRASYGKATPDWLTTACVARVFERLRRIEGHWRATPFGSTLELEFPAR